MDPHRAIHGTRRPRRALLAIGTLALGAATVAGGCSDSSGPDGTEYDPDISPAELSTLVTNPFFPLEPGTTWTYEAETEDGPETIVVEVQPGSREVNGVAARIVRDRVYLEGDLIEDTFDWYAQDDEGNVWYLGEDAKEIEDGEVVSTAGSWEWGVDGALPGIIMWAEPGDHLGEEYRQEFYRGQAEDWGKVVAVDEGVEVPFGAFAGCIVTEDWNALEPGSRENKYYCPGLGVALEVAVQGGGARVELVEVTTP